MDKILALKKTIICVFIALGVGSIFTLKDLKFSFDFGRFFPKGDADVLFYEEFTKEFGPDDNFLLIAIENDTTVFQEDFLNRFNTFTKQATKFSYIKGSQSLTSLFYPLKTSFGYTKLPIIHIGDSAKYASDLAKIKNDSLFIGTFIDEKATSLVVALETDVNLDYDKSIMLLGEVRQSLENYGFEDYHLLGRPFFFEAVVNMQKREVLVTSVASVFLIFLILWMVYRRISIVLISMISITLALLLFLGLLSILGKELTAMAAFYPILMLIVGTSDVIHITDDYLGNLRIGLNPKKAMKMTLNQVGISTLLTSVTTAIGFATLLTSKSSSISNFGINSSLGVLTAYITVILFTCTLLVSAKKRWLLPEKNSPIIVWDSVLDAINRKTIKYRREILLGSLVFTVFCIWGLSKVDTNYQVKNSLPTNSAIAEDFKFFQEKYSGFRPLEMAILGSKTNKVTDFRVIREIEKMERYLKAQQPIRNIQSVATLYKVIHKANHLNKSTYFSLPTDEKTFKVYKKEIRKLARNQLAKVVNTDETKARITGRILDVGTDTLNKIYEQIKVFTNTAIDTTIVKFRLTGSGVLLDKNAFYVRESLIQGLLAGLLMVALVMTILFRNLRLVIVSLLPNLLPLLFAGALLGLFGIPLEATISVVFAIVFGIAVDDTIHFLARLKMCKAKGASTEESLQITFRETGRALIITTFTLFFGFLILLFSVHAPSVTIGLLVSTTLITALVLDLLLLPVLIRALLK